MDQIYKQKYIIKIDESGFGNSVKENYSWLPRVQTATIINDVFKGRANLILGVSQLGDYLGIISNKNVSATDYSLFLKILARALRS